MLINLYIHSLNHHTSPTLCSLTHVCVCPWTFKYAAAIWGFCLSCLFVLPIHYMWGHMLVGTYAFHGNSLAWKVPCFVMRACHEHPKFIFHIYLCLLVWPLIVLSLVIHGFHCLCIRSLPMPTIYAWGSNFLFESSIFSWCSEVST